MVELEPVMSRDYADWRGQSWEDRAEEIRERDGRTCQLCPVGEIEHKFETGKKLHVHHIVKGDRLQKEPARIGLNLITLCIPCHNELEKFSAKHQFELLGRLDVVSVLCELERGWSSTREIAETTGIDHGRVEKIADDLRQLKLAKWSPRRGKYRFPEVPYLRVEYLTALGLIWSMEKDIFELKSAAQGVIEAFDDQDVDRLEEAVEKLRDVEGGKGFWYGEDESKPEYYVK